MLSFNGIPKAGSNEDLQPVPTANNRVVLFREGEDKNKGLGWYTEEQLEGNPNLLFLFGDNDKAKYRTDHHNPGGGGQASITRPTGSGKLPYDRLPAQGGKHGNAIGITTTFYGSQYKYIPNISEFQNLMEQEFAPIETWVKKGGCVVIPCNSNGQHSLGAGIAKLEQNISGATQCIQSKVNALVALGKEVVSNKNVNFEELKEELHHTLLTDCQTHHAKSGLIRHYAMIKKAKQNTLDSAANNTTVKKILLGATVLSGIAIVALLSFSLLGKPPCPNEKGNLILLGLSGVVTIILGAVLAGLLYGRPQSELKEDPIEKMIDQCKEGMSLER